MTLAIVLVAVAGVVPALLFEATRRAGRSPSRSDYGALRRHHDFLDGLAAASRPASAGGRP